MTARLLMSLSLIVVVWLLAGAPLRAEGCVQIGASLFCGTEGAHRVIGRSVIFRSGRPGDLGAGVLRRESERGPTLGQVLRSARPEASGHEPPERGGPGGFIDLQRGKDFGAFVFPLRNRLGATISGDRPGRLGPSLPAFQR